MKTVLNYFLGFELIKARDKKCIPDWVFNNILPALLVDNSNCELLEENIDDGELDIYYDLPNGFPPDYHDSSDVFPPDYHDSDSEDV